MNNRLLSLSINNYRSCVSTNLIFKDNLTALIGYNGAGKTNILTSIVAVSKIERRGYRPRKSAKLNDTEHYSEVVLELSLDSRKYSVKADLYFELNEKEENLVYSELSFKTARASAWLPIETILLDYVDYIGREDFDSFIGRISHREAGRTVRNLATKKKILKFLSSVSYYGATHFADPRNTPTSLELEGGEYVRTYSRSTHEQFLKDLYSAKKKGNPYERFMNIVGPKGLNLIQSVDFDEYQAPTSTYKVQVGGVMKTINRDRLIIIPSVTIGGQKLSLSQLSEGTFKTIALVFYILNDANQLLLIEEPEVYIHHGLLTGLIELIKVQSFQKQILISTHSDFVLDMLQPDNLVLVSKNDEQGTIAQTLKQAMYKDDYTNLRRYLGSVGGLGEYWKESGFLSE